MSAALDSDNNKTKARITPPSISNHFCYGTRLAFVTALRLCAVIGRSANELLLLANCDHSGVLSEWRLSTEAV
jgi:hypothetical protein